MCLVLPHLVSSVQLGRETFTDSLVAVLDVSAFGWAEKLLTKEESAKSIEAAIRKTVGKPTAKLTRVDLGKDTELDLEGNQLADVKGLEKLT